MKKSYRIWLAVLVVGAFLVFFGDLALDRTLNSALLRTLLQDKIGAMLGLTFDYRAVRVSFLPLGIEFRDIEARRADEQEFRATRATADLSWWSLFMGTPKVGNFRIEKPVVRFTRQSTETATAANNTENTVWHWPQLVTHRLERLSISDPDLLLDFTSAAGQHHLLSVQGGELRLDFRSPAKVLITLHLDAVNYRHDDKQRVQDLSLAAEGELGGQGFAFNIERLHANHIEQLRGKVQGSTVVNAQGEMTAPLQVQGDFALRGDLALLDTLLNIERSQGRSRADFSLAMRFAPDSAVAFRAEGRAKVTQAVLGGIKVHDSEAYLTVTPRQLRFRDGRLIVAGQPRGTFRGVINFAAPVIFDFEGTITPLPFAELMSTFNTELDLFNFDIATPHVHVHGTGKPFSLQVQANTHLSAVQIYTLRNHRPPPVCALQLDLRSDRQHLHFQHLRGSCTRGGHDSGALALHGKIAYGTGQLDLHITAPALNLAALDFLSPQTLRGEGALTTTLRGTGSGVVVSSKIALRNVQLNDHKIGAIVGELDFHRHFVAWRAVRLRAAHGGEVLSSRGRLTYADLRFNAHLTGHDMRAVDLQPLLQQAKLPLSFGIDKLTARLSGFLPFPLAYRGTLRAQVRELRATEGERIADAASFAVETGKRGWRLTLHSLQRGALMLHGTVTQRRRVTLVREKFAASPHLWERLGLSRRDRLRVQLSAQQKDKTAQQLPYLGEYFAARFTVFRLKLAGAVQNLRGEVQAELATVMLAGLQLGTLRLAGEVDGGTVAVQLHNATRSLWGQVQVDLAVAQLPFTWQLSCDAFDMRQLWGHDGDENNYARVSGRWDMRGKLLRWFDASGEVSLATLQVRHRSDPTRERAFSLRLQEPRRILFTRGELAVVGDKKITFHSGDSLLVLTALPESTLRQPRLDVHGVIDTAILPHFLDEVDISTGFLQLDGKLRWQRNESQFSLEVERLSPLAISVAGLRPAFNDIDIRASYRRGTLRIEKLQGRKGEGLIVAQGEIHWRDREQSFLQLDLRNAHFIHPILGFKNTELHLDGDLTLRWRELPLALEGKLTVTRASNFSDFDIRKVILASFGGKNTVLRRRSARRRLTLTSTSLLIDP